jgi:hypothetical protein
MIASPPGKPKRIMMMWNSPNYSYKVVGDVLVIYDLWNEENPTCSVTNGVEDVLQEIVKALGHLPPYIVYRDTEHLWDEIRSTTDGEFTGFGSLGEIVRDEWIAIERVQK